MEFKIVFYESKNGGNPVQKFLDKLKASDPDDFAIIMAGLAKLKNRAYHRPPLSKPIGDGLLELRHIGKLNTRVLYFFSRGKRIILVHGIHNKARGIPKRDLEVAKSRKSDWIARYSI